MQKNINSHVHHIILKIPIFVKSKIQNHMIFSPFSQKRVFAITLTSMSFHHFYPQYPQNYPHVYIAYCYFNSFQNAMSFAI